MVLDIAEERGVRLDLSRPFQSCYSFCSLCSGEWEAIESFKQGGSTIGFGFLKDHNSYSVENILEAG